MKRRELEDLGVARGPQVELATRLIRSAAQAGLRKEEIRSRLIAAIRDPQGHLEDAHFGELARWIASTPTAPVFLQRASPAPWHRFGTDLDPASIRQLENACRLPVSVAGALLPDAHVGYGLPIGGVLATENAVIPFAVGVDIACRMKLSVFDLPPQALRSEPDRLIHALEQETRFGIGASFRKRHDHDVMDREWKVTPTTARLKDKAHAQLGSSGSGNHFVEFGLLTLDREELGLPAGSYLALLSHSGSRGPGATVADTYSRLAMAQHPELPVELRQLAWLDLDSQAGQEYWAAMTLMGEYAAANHAVIHRSIARQIGARAILEVENHHNFAWRERHLGRELIVHRKGATPAGPGVLGIIPGSMASPGFLVRGKGNAASLDSASHGAGRVMSRTQARARFSWGDVTRHLAEKGVRLLSAGIDEAPMVYKDIHAVMAQQGDLVTTLARFDPQLVKMCPDGARPED